jgi:hypothetical protein
MDGIGSLQRKKPDPFSIMKNRYIYLFTSVAFMV